MNASLAIMAGMSRLPGPEELGGQPMVFKLVDATLSVQIMLFRIHEAPDSCSARRWHGGRETSREADSPGGDGPQKWILAAPAVQQHRRRRRTQRIQRRVAGEEC